MKFPSVNLVETFEGTGDSVVSGAVDEDRRTSPEWKAFRIGCNCSWLLCVDISCMWWGSVGPVVFGKDCDAIDCEELPRIRNPIQWCNPSIAYP